MHNFPTHFWRKFQDDKDRTALVCIDEEGVRTELTYWEWTRRVQRLALALVEEGFQPGARLGMVAPTCRDWLDLAFASWLVGGCLVPVAHGASRSKTLRALARSGCEWIAIDDGPALRRLRGSNDDLPEHLQWIAFDGAGSSEKRGVHDLAELDELGRSLAVRGRVDDLAEIIYEVDADQPTLILFEPTLGDDPHGAYFRGASVGQMLAWLGEDLQFEDGELLVTTREFADYRAWLMTAATLLQGVPVATTEAREPIGTHLEQLRPTRLVCDRAFLTKRADKLLDRVESSSKSLEADGGADGGLGSMLREVGKKAARRLFYDPLDRAFGGRLAAAYVVDGSLPEDLAGVLDRANLTPLGLYGTPESGISHIERPGARREGSVGRPVQGYTCKIEGAKRGASGPILVRSDVLFDDYWDGDGPREVDENGWLQTGDEGRIESGYLFL
ncbi:MAG: AMP-binding protein [Persicimonas sp.]